MVGQGSPRAFPTRLAGAICVACPLLAIALSVARGWAPESASGESTVRLRIAWGSREAARWRGEISVSSGAILHVATPGAAGDSPAGFQIIDGTLRVDARPPQEWQEIEIEIDASLDATVRVHLESDENDHRSFDEDFLLASLIAGELVSPRGKSDEWLTLQRAPGDALRVKIAGDSLVFFPGERVRLECLPNVLSADEGERLSLEAVLTRTTERRAVWQESQAFQAPAQDAAAERMTVSFPAPEAEGVYDLTLSARRGGLRRGLTLSRTVAERRVQLVVVGRQRPEHERNEGQPPTDVVFELDPARSDWRDRLKIPSLSLNHAAGPFGSGDTIVREEGSRRWLQLGRREVGEPTTGEPSWAAFPLSIQRPGQPHVLEVEYDSSSPQRIGVSIAEADASGSWPVGFETGVATTPETLAEAADAGEAAVGLHRLIFWPRTKNPRVVLTDRGGRAPASIGKIRVRGAKPPQALALGKDGRHSYLPPAFADRPTSQRLLAAYLEKPLFGPAFRAPETPLAETEGPFNDWKTFYDGGTRTIEYLRHVGFNGLMLAAFADGGALYPSTLVASTPRYDRGALAPSDLDPVRKDVLGLLFRLFDREGMQLVPLLDFSMPLPALEERLATDADATGIVLVDDHGLAWPERFVVKRGRAPYYNILDSRVQQAIVDIVGELLERYRHHAALTGVAVQLSADGFAQFPGSEWGCDDVTWSQFVEQLEGDRESGEPPSPRELRSKPELRKKWLDWRAAKVAAFYRRLATEIAKSKPGTRLYLSPTGSLEGPGFEKSRRPGLPRTASLGLAFLEAGIDPAQFQSLDQVVLLRPQRISTASLTARRALDDELNESPEIDRLFQGGAASASLFWHEAREVALPSFERTAVSERSKERTIAVSSPAGWHNRRRFAHALATLDSQAIFDGGRLLPLGQEAAWTDLAALYRELPDARFATYPVAPQPLTIRTLSWRGKTYLYVVNDCAWASEATLSLRLPARCSSSPLGFTPAPSDAPAKGGEWEWTIELAPYSAAGLMFDQAGVAVTASSVQVDPRAERQMAARVQDLIQRVRAVASAPAWEVLDDPGFEAAPEEGRAFAHWEAFEDWGLSATRVNVEPHDGDYCVRLAANAGSGYLRSAPLPEPRTGRLQATVWLRTSSGERQPPVRVSLAGRCDGSEFYRFAAYGEGQPADRRLSEEWKAFTVKFVNLPLGEWEDLRLRFDLLGPGEVWVDDVRLTDLAFSPVPEQRELAFGVAAAQVQLQEGRMVDCQRFLDGFWPRVLEANVDLPLSAMARRETPATSPASEMPKRERPGFLDRFRRALPAFLR